MTSPGPWSWGAGAGKWVLCDANDKRMISFHEWSIEDGDMALIAAAPTLLAMLLELHAALAFCPICRDGSGRRAPWHLPDCRFDALLLPFRKAE